ncbi:MAG: YbhB/YbcL family Raf kinase inhibitor-like protein [Pseudomonadales bacterium]|nr:YbhB/YbcL family Raf kinase inhibitor-like protein [Pseudomonadales bacterium]
MLKSLTLLWALIIGLSTSVFAGSLNLSSEDISQGEFMSKAQEFNGFGCTGGDISPQLKWSDAPEGTKSFAITAYDPDAPTGSGWWHWQLVNIPSNVTELASGAGSTKKELAPKGSMQIENDYGSRGFGGACPPPGHGIHHYRYTVHALSVEKLALPENASGALAGYMINANTIETSTIESLYKRD